MQGALPQWSAAVQARSAERGDAAGDVAKGVGIGAHRDFGNRIGGQLRESSDFDE
jgi:hypothetical protein